MTTLKSVFMMFLMFGLITLIQGAFFKNKKQEKLYENNNNNNNPFVDHAIHKIFGHHKHYGYYGYNPHDFNMDTNGIFTSQDYDGNTIYTTMNLQQPFAVTINRPFPYPVPQPIPVSIPRPVPVSVPQPIPVAVDRPYPVPVPHAYPVPITKTFAFPILGNGYNYPSLFHPSSKPITVTGSTLLAAKPTSFSIIASTLAPHFHKNKHDSYNGLIVNGHHGSTGILNNPDGKGIGSTSAPPYSFSTIANYPQYLNNNNNNDNNNYNDKNY